MKYKDKINTYDPFSFSPLQKELYVKLKTKEIKPWNDLFDLECIRDVSTKDGKVLFREGEILTCRAEIEITQHNHPIRRDEAVVIYKKRGLFDECRPLSSLQGCNFTWNFKLKPNSST